MRSYPVVEKDQLVWVWTGDPAKADKAKIVDFPYHNDPGNGPTSTTSIRSKATTC